jgi:hypothetical protein
LPTPDRSRRNRRALVRGLLGAAAAGLAAFHASLLAQRLADPGALDGAAALRWLGASAILGALLRLRRRGPALDGRRAFALALAVLLLHAPVLQGTEEQARASELFVVLPPLALPALALLGLAAAGRRSAAPARANGTLVPCLAFAAPGSPHLAVVAPRPPPPSC